MAAVPRVMVEDGVIDVVRDGVALLTTWVNTVLVLVLKLVSPAYEAVIE